MRLGEAWKDGVAVVSWDDLRATIRGRNPGRNLILHEFAHILDMEDGEADGTPDLAVASSTSRGAPSWSTSTSGSGATAPWVVTRCSIPTAPRTPAEFFAVATEAFFEKTQVLAKRHPELYAEFRAFYRQDVARLRPFEGPDIAVRHSATSASGCAVTDLRHCRWRLDREHAFAMPTGLVHIVPPAVLHARSRVDRPRVE